jgi:hypothetical protein
MELVKMVSCTILYRPSVCDLLYQIADEVLLPDFKMSLEAAAVKSAERQDALKPHVASLIMSYRGRFRSRHET